MVFELPTNYSNGTIANGPGKFFMDYPSAIIQNWAGGLLILIWMMIFAVGSYMGNHKAILSASFVSTIFAIYFSVRGWLNPIVTIVLIILTIVFAIITKSDGGY